MSLLTKQTLLKQLCHFGLNPKEWQLSMGKNWSKVKLTHKKDPNFQLVGVVSTSKTKWQSLSFANL